MTRPLTTFRSALLVAGLLLLATASLAACPRNGLRIGYLNLGGNYQDGAGIDVDIIKELSKRSGCAISRAEEMPRLRSIKMLATGDLNLLPSLALTPERAALGYALHYEVSKNLVVMDKKIPPKSIEALASMPNLLWGVVRGYAYSPRQAEFIQQQRAMNKVLDANDTEDLFQLLDKGLVHAVLAHPLAFSKNLQRMPVSQRPQIFDAFPDDPPLEGVILLSRLDFTEQDALRWHVMLQQMKDDGTLLAIMARHTDANIATHLLPARIGLRPGQPSLIPAR